MRYFTWKLELVSDILWLIVGNIKEKQKISISGYLIYDISAFIFQALSKKWKLNYHISGKFILNLNAHFYLVF